MSRPPHSGKSCSASVVGQIFFKVGHKHGPGKPRRKRRKSFGPSDSYSRQNGTAEQPRKHTNALWSAGPFAGVSAGVPSTSARVLASFDYTSRWAYEVAVGANSVAIPTGAVGWRRTAGLASTALFSGPSTSIESRSFIAHHRVADHSHGCRAHDIARVRDASAGRTGILIRGRERRSEALVAVAYRCWRPNTLTANNITHIVGADLLVTVLAVVLTGLTRRIKENGS